MSLVIRWAEQGVFPDRALRWGIRTLIRERRRELVSGSAEERRRRTEVLLQALAQQSVAADVEAANTQHYEVPARFFEAALGPQLKYSCCLWQNGTEDLAAAEEAMLRLSAERAQLADGQRILELGCGWGSLTLWMARHYPNARIVAVSNSSSQREHIERRLDQLRHDHDLADVVVRTCDVNELQLTERFERVVSVEMFEHMRNVGALMARITSWLDPGGKLFVHVFSHRTTPYLFEDRGAGDWMARHFFTGGMMPSHDLLQRLCGEGLRLEHDWVVSGEHYARTGEAWLANLDRRREAIRGVLAARYGIVEADVWIGRWRLFFLAVAELFAYRGGSEWHVSHYRFARR